MVVITPLAFMNANTSTAKQKYVASLKKDKESSKASNHSYMLQSELDDFIVAFNYKKDLVEINSKLKEAPKGEERKMIEEEKSNHERIREGFSASVRKKIEMPKSLSIILRKLSKPTVLVLKCLKT